ncbi:MAG: hypothetical protein C7B45_10195 [Sulfobacillus acidophilus]|uniref:Uncharacterized protein n=1 Tax=Sulfobacillus acidophilus TaxID=53633 RepID=A0A2T2WH52_9FIRM|nr:MAG: hypothetical protein C7B45_10195 [Sulfobacillus acidophilus]
MDKSIRTETRPLVQFDKFSHNCRMKRAAIILVACLVAGILGWQLYHRLARHQETLVLTNLCRTYLVDAAELPSPAASASIKRITVPFSQAILSAQSLADSSTPNPHIRQARVHVSSLTFSGSRPLVVHASVVVSRIFSPHGTSHVSETATFWVTQGKIEIVRFNTNESNSSQGPDAFNLNLWNQVPAAPLPHGQ